MAVRFFSKEYGPSLPAAAAVDLKGVVVCLDHFDSATNLVAPAVATKDEEPAHYKYVDMSRDQDRLWDQEMKALQKQNDKTNRRQIGNMRDGFGIVMSHVYALNDPAAWLAEGLKYDLEQEGAKVVPASEATTADARISGTIQLCNMDMYMTVSGELVVNIDVRPKVGSPLHRQIHTHGATAAMLASEGEYFHALRDCREKFSIIVSQEITRAIKSQQAAK